MRKVFVFGSNLEGRHGLGAALYAVEHKGAIYGQGEGLQGDSYGIPTRYTNQDGKIATLDLQTIDYYVKRFIEFAKKHQELTFNVTPIGTGHAGYNYSVIALLFKDAPKNCILPDAFKNIIKSGF
jgi:hypothetical protein